MTVTGAHFTRRSWRTGERNSSRTSGSNVCARLAGRGGQPERTCPAICLRFCQVDHFLAYDSFLRGPRVSAEGLEGRDRRVRRDHGPVPGLHHEDP